MESKAEQLKLEAEFNSLLEKSPELRKYEDTIRKLQKIEGGSFEEVALRNNLTSEDKLAKAKSSRKKMRGEGTGSKEPKSILDMSPEEFEEWKKDS